MELRNHSIWRVKQFNAGDLRKVTLDVMTYKQLIYGAKNRKKTVLRDLSHGRDLRRHSMSPEGA